MSGPQCIKNPPILNSSSGIGNLQEIGGLSSYVTGGSIDSEFAILLISDVFGYEAPLLRKLADKIAAAGYLVVVPDFFYGEPLDLEKHDVQTWLKDHGTDKGCEDAKAVVETLKSKGVSAIGVAGFCWGGMVVAKLAKYDTIGAAVILHPGPITIDEINEVKVPTAILAAEHDHIFPADQAKLLGDALSAKSEIESFVKIFPGVEHGWTVRYNVEDESAVKAAEEAHSDMLNWFTKFIK